MTSLSPLVPPDIGKLISQLTAASAVVGGMEMNSKGAQKVMLEHERAARAALEARISEVLRENQAAAGKVLHEGWAVVPDADDPYASPDGSLSLIIHTTPERARFSHGRLGRVARVRILEIPECAHSWQVRPKEYNTSGPVMARHCTKCGEWEESSYNSQGGD